MPCLSAHTVADRPPNLPTPKTSPEQAPRTKTSPQSATTSVTSKPCNPYLPPTSSLSPRGETYTSIHPSCHRFINLADESLKLILNRGIIERPASAIWKATDLPCGHKNLVSETPNSMGRSWCMSFVPCFFPSPLPRMNGGAKGTEEDSPRFLASLLILYLLNYFEAFPGGQHRPIWEACQALRQLRESSLSCRALFPDDPRLQV